MQRKNNSYSCLYIRLSGGFAAEQVRCFAIRPDLAARTHILFERAFSLFAQVRVRLPAEYGRRGLCLRLGQGPGLGLCPEFGERPSCGIEALLAKGPVKAIQGVRLLAERPVERAAAYYSVIVRQSGRSGYCADGAGGQRRCRRRQLCR